MHKLLIVAAVFAASAFAHFEVLYTPATVVESGDARISSFFTHPFEGGPIMTRGKGRDGAVEGDGVKEVFVVHRGERSNLRSATREVKWMARGGLSAQGSEITLSGPSFRSMGDYAVVVVGYPYWEAAENVYIQQVAKLIVSKGESLNHWKERMLEGYTEIIPLTNPHNMTKGQIFRAQAVDCDGNPAAGILVEAKLLNHQVNQVRATTGMGRAFTSDEKKGSNQIVTDANGVFAFVPQVSGFWGFAAIGAGKNNEHNGEELELSPVLWIQVAD